MGRLNLRFHPGSFLARNRTHLPQLEAVPFSARAEAEEGSLEKDLLEVLATNAKTLRGTLSPNVGFVAEANCRINL